MVSALGLAAVMVPDAPSATATPLYVTELLVSDALAMLDSVLDAPLMVLLVSVSVVARPTKVSVDVGSVRVPVLTMVEMTGEVSVLLVNVCDAVFVVTVSDPTVAEVMLNAPPVTVLPVKVKALGKLNVTLVVPVDVISLAVPLTDATAPMPPAVMVVFPAKVSWPWALTVNVPTCVAEP